MDNKDLRELKESFLKLQEGLTVFESFLDTIKNTVGNVREKADVLINTLQEAERGRETLGVIKRTISHFNKFKGGK